MLSTHESDSRTLLFNSRASGELRLEQPFKWWSAEQLGTDPKGDLSAHVGSLRPIAPGGFVSVILPFFSTTMLPDERGAAKDVTDFRPHHATRANGKTPRFSCVRLSWNGEIVHQICDPNESVDGVTRTTGVVRAAVEELWNDLRRAHYIDTSSRAMVITMQLASPNLGVGSRVLLMFEFTPAGGVMASYDTFSQVTDRAQLAVTSRYTWIAFAFTFFFCSLELIEVVQGGLSSYFANMWNVMDWLNYIIFFFAFVSTIQYLDSARGVDCMSELCVTTGFADDYKTMHNLRSAKQYLSLCVCIQLLKMAKFTSALVPKMGLAPLVLKKALPDLVFFGFIFTVSMLAFSTLFYVQLGPVMIEYSTNFGAFISLSRALFGDFDIEEILSNSSGYSNAILFIAYLFIAVFILLSMFFAILGESQANVRDDERDSLKEAKANGTAIEPQYGIITHTYNMAKGVLSHAPIIGGHIRANLASQTTTELKAAIDDSGPTAVDRVEARQLEMLDGLQELFAGVHKGLETLAGKSDVLKDLIAAGGTVGGSSRVTQQGRRRTSKDHTDGPSSTDTAATDSPVGDGAYSTPPSGLAEQVASIHAMMMAAQQQQQQQLKAEFAVLREQLTSHHRKRRAHTRTRGSEETRELYEA